MILVIFSLIITSLYCIFELPFNLSILQLCEYNYIDYVKTKYKNYKPYYLKLVIDATYITLQILKINLFAIITYFVIYLGFCVYINKIKTNKYILTKRIFRFFAIYITLVLLSETIFLLARTLGRCALLYVFVTISPVLLFFLNQIIISIFEAILLKLNIKKSKNKLDNSNAKIIAITGSYGKTSVKNFLYTLLSQKYNVIMTPKSYNTINGVCLTVNNNLLAGVDYIILEMGARRKGDIKKLCKLFPPYYGILTSIGEQHLKTFHNINNIYATKIELQNAVSLNGFMTFNCYNELTKHASECYLGNSINVGVDYVISDFIQKEDGISFFFKSKGLTFPVDVPLYGFHNAINLSLAIATCFNLGLNIDQIKFGLENIAPVDSRLKPSKLRDNIIFNNGYNSNPHSATCSLEVISSFKNYNKIVITPGFVEMGKKSYELNFEFGKQIAKTCDMAYIVNQINRKALIDGIRSIDNRFKLYLVDHFHDIDFTGFNNSVVLIENDLPSNYV